MSSSPGIQMKHSVPNKKGETDELRILLRAPENLKDQKRYLQAVQKVIAYMTIGVDVSKLFSDMIMAGATPNLVQKKLVYHYICSYAESHADLAILTVNTLMKDSQDPNPVVRGLALRSMCALRIPNLVDYIREPLKAGLQDRSPYVRRTAVMGCVKLFYFVPEFIKSLNLTDILYRMLRDKDPLVVCNCISALNEILAGEGGIVLNRSISHYLINRLKEFNEWSQCLVMGVLTKYTPADEEEMYDMLNVLDDRLNHANSGVVMGAVCLFLHLTNDCMEMHTDVYERIKSPLLTFLGGDSPELVYTCLQHLQLLVARQNNLLQPQFKSFFCRYNDPPYLKIKKIEILIELASPENGKDIVEEMGEYATDVSMLVAGKAVEAMGHIALHLAEHAQTCVVKLLSLLSVDLDFITAGIMVAFTKILRNYESMLEVILPSLPTTPDGISSPEGRAAFVWILGEYGDILPNSPYVLEEMVSTVSEESSLVKLHLLTAVMKLFFKRPPECQEMLGRLLEYAVDEEADMDVHDRGMLYYRLLKHDVTEAKRVVCGSSPRQVTEGNRVLPRLRLFNEFNTLSVMYEDLSENFVEQKPPYSVVKDSTVTDGSLKAELTFDTGRFVPESYSSSSGEPGTPRLQRKESQESEPVAGVPIADLLGDLDFSSAPSMPVEEKKTTFLLSKEASLSSADFEKKWFGLRLSDEMKLGLAVVPTPEELTRTMQERSVFTMASSPPDHAVMKFYFYAQHSSTPHYLLVEAAVDKASQLMTVSLKCEEPDHVEPFMRYFRESLIGRWMVAGELDLL